MPILLALFVFLLTSCNQSENSTSSQEDSLNEIFVNSEDSKTELNIRIVKESGKIVSVTDNNKKAIPFHLGDEISLFKGEKKLTVDETYKVTIQDAVCFSDKEEDLGLKNSWPGRDFSKTYKAPISMYEIIPYETYIEFYGDDLYCRFNVLVSEGDKVKKYTFTKQEVADFTNSQKLILKKNNKDIDHNDILYFRELSELFLIDESETKGIKMLYKVFCEKKEVFSEEKENSNSELPIPILTGLLSTSENLHGVQNCRILLEPSFQSIKSVKALSSIFLVDFGKEKQKLKKASIDDLPIPFSIKNDPNLFRIDTSEWPNKTDKEHYATSWFEFDLSEDLDYSFVDLKVETSCDLDLKEETEIITKSYQVPLRHSFPVMMVTPVEVFLTRKMSKDVISQVSKEWFDPNKAHEVMKTWHWWNAEKQACTYEITFIDTTTKLRRKHLTVEKSADLFWMDGSYGVRESSTKNPDSFRLGLNEFIFFPEHLNQKIEPTFFDQKETPFYYKKSGDIDKVGLICSFLLSGEISQSIWTYDEDDGLFIDDGFFLREGDFSHDLSMSEVDLTDPNLVDKYKACRVVFYENYQGQNLIKYFSKEFIFSYKAYDEEDI